MSDAQRKMRAVSDAMRRRPVAVGMAIVAVVAVAVLGARLFGPASEVLVVEAEDRVVEADEGAAAGGDGADASLKTIFVHVTGSVASPGLYELADGARVAEAVEAAGGFAEGAATDAVNLARVLFDGEQIVVPSVESTAEAGASGAQTGSATEKGKVNINTADAAELDEITGVGPSTAEKIIADREQNGPFATIEDLKRVSGIGDKKFESMRDEICVG